MATTLQVDQIRIDGGTQSRGRTDAGTVAAYAAAIEAGAKFPPGDVFFDGADYWAADIFHRLAAHKAAGRKFIECTIHQGSLRDAVLFSVGANATHGLPRSNADKARAVHRLLDDPDWSKWSDRKIAKICRVTHPFVARLRKDRAGATGSVTMGERLYTRAGKTQTMKLRTPAAKPTPAPSSTPSPKLAAQRAEPRRKAAAKAHRPSKAEPGQGACPDASSEFSRIQAQIEPLIGCKLTAGYGLCAGSIGITALRSLAGLLGVKGAAA